MTPRTWRGEEMEVVSETHGFFVAGCYAWTIIVLWILLVFTASFHVDVYANERRYKRGTQRLREVVETLQRPGLFYMDFKTGRWRKVGDYRVLGRYSVTASTTAVIQARRPRGQRVGS